MRVEHLAQVRLGIQAVQLRRADQAVDRRGALAAGVRAGEEVVLAAERHRAQRALGGVVVDVDVAVVAVADQCRPARERVADRDRQRRLRRHLRQGRLEPSLDVLEQRPGACLAHRAPLLGRPAADRLLDLVELADSRQRLGRHRRAVRLVDLVELAPHVRPAGRLPDPFVLVLVEPIEPGVAVGLQDAGERLQVGFGVLAPAVGRVAEQHRRGCACRPTADRRGHRSRAARSWSCRDRARAPAPGCRRRAGRGSPRRSARAPRPADRGARPLLRRSRRASSARAPPPRGRRSATADTAAGDRRTWPPGCGRATPGRQCRARSGGSEQVPARSSGTPHRRASGARAGSP